jgi:hypothetical protein
MVRRSAFALPSPSARQPASSSRPRPTGTGGRRARARRGGPCAWPGTVAATPSWRWAGRRAGRGRGPPARAGGQAHDLVRLLRREVLEHDHRSPFTIGERRRRGRRPGRLHPRGGDAEHLVLPRRGDVPEHVRRRAGPRNVVRRRGVLRCGGDDVGRGSGGRIDHADGGGGPVAASADEADQTVSTSGARTAAGTGARRVFSQKLRRAVFCKFYHEFRIFSSSC